MVPIEVNNADNVQQVVVYCESIALATRVSRYLKTLAPVNMVNRAVLVKPLHSLMSADYRDTLLAAFDRGEIRIIVATNCICVGVDLKIKCMVCLSLPDSVSLMTQWMGRAGRGVEGAEAIIYGPDPLRKETELEKKGSAALNITKMSDKRLSDREEF